MPCFFFLFLSSFDFLVELVFLLTFAFSFYEKINL